MPPNYPNPLWGCQSPRVTQETPGFVFCSKDTQAPDTSHLCCDFEDLGRSKHHLSHALPPFPTPAKHLSHHQLQNLPPEDSRRGWLCCRGPPHTCEDGLVDAQGGGADFDDPDVCWHLVTNCKDRSRAALSLAAHNSKPQTNTNRVTSAWSNEGFSPWQRVLHWDTPFLHLKLY